MLRSSRCFSYRVIKHTTMKIVSTVMPSSTDLVVTKVSTATAVYKKKLQQFIALMVLIVAANCLELNKIVEARENNDDEQLLQKLKDIRLKCMQQAALLPEQRQLIFDHKLFTTNTTLATTPKALQCYCLCFLNESNIFSQDKPNEKYLRKVLPLMVNSASKANAVLDKCLNLHGNDNCEIGFNFELCLIKGANLYM